MGMGLGGLVGMGCRVSFEWDMGGWSRGTWGFGGWGGLGSVRVGGMCGGVNRVRCGLELGKFTIRSGVMGWGGWSRMGGGGFDRHGEG